MAALESKVHQIEKGQVEQNQAFRDSINEIKIYQIKHKEAMKNIVETTTTALSEMKSEMKGIRSHSESIAVNAARLEGIYEATFKDRQG